jgi:HK97 family phage portal protein
MNVTASSALTLPAYYAILRLISQTVAMLPRAVYRRLARGREKLATHPISRLLNNPNPTMNGMAFWESHIHHAVGWGGGLAWIERARFGDAVALWPLDPANVELRIIDGTLYVLYPRRGATPEFREIPETINYANVFHTHGMGYNGLAGYSLIQIAREAIGAGLAQQQFSSAYFGNDAALGTYIVPPVQATPDQVKAFKENLQQVQRENAFRPTVLPPGVTVERGAIPGQDAQLIETGQFQVVQMCRFAGVPPHKIASLERSTYSNIEHQAIEWVQDGVMPWTTRVEQEAGRKLFGPRPGAMYVRHNLDGLLRGDYKTRTDGDSSLVAAGIISPDEAREHYERNAIPGGLGAKFFMQGGMKTMEDIVEPPEPPPPPMPPQLPPPGEDEEDEEETEARAQLFRVLSAHRSSFEAAARHVVRREIKATRKAHPKRRDDREELLAWANRFHSSQRRHVVDAFGPHIEALTRTAAACSGISCDVNLRPCLDSWQRDSLKRLAALEDPEELEALELVLAQELSGAVFNLTVTTVMEAVDAG